MRLPREFVGRLVLVASVLFLVACGSSPTATPVLPAPSPQPAASARPASSPTPEFTPTAVATPLPSPTPSPSPAASATEGWQTVTVEDALIRLPAGWRVVELTDRDAAAAFELLREQQPFRAGLLDSADALRESALLAVAPDREGFADSLNIRRVMLNAERLTDLRTQVVDVVAGQYEKFGFAPELVMEPLRTASGLPMAAIAFDLPPERDSVAVRSLQYFIATDTHLWILTYSTIPERSDAAFPIFEQSARSFALR